MKAHAQAQGLEPPRGVLLGGDPLQNARSLYGNSPLVARDANFSNKYLLKNRT
jgi:hypothetical protein